MHKVSKPFRRPDRPRSWWVRWFENGHKHTKSFLFIDEAKMWRKRKYIELNRDVYSDIDMPWAIAEKEYLDRYDIRGLEKASKYEAARTLRSYAEHCVPRYCKYVTQQTVNEFIKQRIDSGVSKHTVNKDISRLRAFLNWLRKRHYLTAEIEIVQIKAPLPVKKALTTPEIQALFKACNTPEWRIRILLSLVTGLRSSDIDNLTLGQLNLKAATIDTDSRKTKKRYIGRPLPSSAIPALQNYLDGLAIKSCEAKLLPDRNVKNMWFVIRDRAGLPTVTRQDFRVTFSTLMQKISGIGTAQNLLEHSDSRTTADFYTDIQAVLFWKIQQLNPIIKEWLK